MKNLLTLPAAAIALLLLTQSSQAQIVTWGTAQTMVGTSDISTAGTFVSAVDFNSTQTIGDTTFTEIAASDGANDGYITLSGAFSGYGGTAFTPNPASTPYLDVMSSIAFTIGSAGSIKLGSLADPLVVGDSYQLEVWGSYDGSPGANNTTFSGPAGSNSVTLDPNLNVYALGAFTATATTETIGFTPGTNYSVFDAVSLRDTTGSAPEPSTYVLLGVGFLGLVILQRRKLQSQS